LSGYFLGFFGLDALPEIKGKVPFVAFPEPKRVESGDFGPELEGLIHWNPALAGFEHADPGLAPADILRERTRRLNPLCLAQPSKAFTLVCVWGVIVLCHGPNFATQTVLGLIPICDA
jgi:hypothetical protein